MEQIPTPPQNTLVAESYLLKTQQTSKIPNFSPKITKKLI